MSVERSFALSSSVQVGNDWSMGKSLGKHGERWICIAGRCIEYCKESLRLLRLILRRERRIGSIEIYTGGNGRALQVRLPVCTSLRVEEPIILCISAFSLLLVPPLSLTNPPAGALRAHARLRVHLAPGLDEGDITLRFYALSSTNAATFAAESSAWSSEDADSFTMELFAEIPNATTVLFEVTLRPGLLGTTEHMLIVIAAASVFFNMCVASSLYSWFQFLKIWCRQPTKLL